MTVSVLALREVARRVLPLTITGPKTIIPCGEGYYQRGGVVGRSPSHTLPFSQHGQAEAL